MSWRNEKTSNGYDFVWDNAQTGIGPSPLLGTANLQNVNIATDLGEVMASYARTAQLNSSTQPSITNGTLTASVLNGTQLLATSSAIKQGFWINISSSTIARTNLTIEYFVVAGGGGGGGSDTSSPRSGGGGGAGGVSFGSASVSISTYAVTIGAGGSGGSGGNQGSDGSNSSINTITTATGGGGGGGSTTKTGRNGGSGGGGGSNDSGTSSGGTGTSGQGSNGGGVGNNDSGAGGGGGYFEIGTAGDEGLGGKGGGGFTTSISGSSVTYAGGGGGGSGSTPGQGGNGGGGNGGQNANGSNGTANTGGGGGGASTDGAAVSHTGGTGGSGIVIIKYPTGMMNATGGTITTSGGFTIHTFTSNGNFQVTSANLSGLYFVSFQDSTNKIKISPYYDPRSEDPVIHGTSGTATFSTFAPLSPASPIAKAWEKYVDTDSVEYRYYILDSESYLWVYDSGAVEAIVAAGGIAPKWMLPDSTDYGSDPIVGMNVLNGWVHAFRHNTILLKKTVALGQSFSNMTGVSLMNIDNSTATIPHFAYVGRQGKLYYTDSTYIGEIFPTTSISTGNANVQSYCEWSVETSTTIDIEVIINGSSPLNAFGVSGRMPVFFFAEQGGTTPPVLSEGTVYWLGVSDFLNGIFEVYTASSGGSPLTITGGSGNQYFNTYYPLDGGSPSGSNPSLTFSNQRVNLPTFEIAKCMVEIGNTVLIGGKTNTLYPWNQIDATPSDLIELPEADVTTMINVNNIAYVFAGIKGNIYVSNNSVASLVAKIPDYCAGVPGSFSTYIEPNFTWGDSMFLRGRVYFSVLDQTSTKEGNCGGVWSFIPTQNIAAGQDVGIAMRLENQNSYGDYNGLCTVLIPNQEQQDGISPQYWSGWQDSYNIATSSFGIDYTDIVPVVTSIVETDLLSTGTLLDKTTFQQLEYKTVSPLQDGDSIQLLWRLNGTDEWQSAGTVNEETDNRISGYFTVNFEKGQWLQLRAELTTNGTLSSSFNRLKDLRAR